MTIVLLLASPAAAQTFPERGRSPVVDQADLLTAEQELDLSSKSEALEASTGRQFVVATVNSLEGREIEDYGYRLGRHWGIGRAEEDDGVILLVAPNEKKVRIETGYGAEGFLPDILAGRIIRNDILPRFRDGDMAGGIMAGAGAILEQMRLPEAEARQRADQVAAEAERDEGFPGFIPVAVIMIIGFVILSALGRRTGGRRYRHHRGKRRGRRGDDDGIPAWVILWGLSEIAGAASRGRRGGWGGGGGFGGWGGGGGGGFGGFSGGGGSFGGGGASGGW